MFEWLERFGYGAEDRPEARGFAPGLDHLATGKLCQLNNKWVPGSNQEKAKASKGEGWALRCSGPLIPPPLRPPGYSKSVPFLTS